MERWIRASLLTIGTATSALAISAAPAQAYIDPSAGSILLQLALGGVAGVLVALKLSFGRLTSRFRRRGPDPAADTPPPGDPHR